MKHFEVLLNEELDVQKSRLIDSRRALARAPQGYLKRKSRNTGNSFYQVHGDEAFCEVNITEDSRKIGQLLRKRINEETAKTAEINIKWLEKLLGKYSDNEKAHIISELPLGYKAALNYLGENPEAIALKAYPRAPYDPRYHKHETVAGIWVRSKSEAFIVNALTYYNIPFNYEERFPYLDEDGHFVYPDFTFHLPTGETIIWEHLGLLDKKKYCLRTANKLALYQQHGFIIYKNLILTMDDNQGNCSSGLTDEIIRTMLLPYYQ